MVRWKDAAVQNPVLTAAELYFMAHPDERVPWRQLLSFPPPHSSDAFSPAVTMPAPEKWGVRKRRSSKATTAKVTAVVKEAEEEKVPGRASPTTPLSWDACEFGCVPKDSPPTKKRPIICGSVANGGNGGGRAGGGSAKVAAELKEWERSLTEKNMLLKKEVEQQKLAQSILMEENKRLKSLESQLHQKIEAETGVTNAKSDEAKSEERRSFPFDLNLPLPGDPESVTD